MPDAVVARLAEKSLGNGWQIDQAVEACMSLAHVLGRGPTSEEIDEIAASGRRFDQKS